MIRVFHPGSGSQIRIPDPDPDFLPIPEDPDPGVIKALDPRSASATLISRRKKLLKGKHLTS
jgi:hypothetical protein